MNKTGFFSRFRRLRSIRYAAGKIRSKNFAEAGMLVTKLLDEEPKSVVCHILLGDIFLFDMDNSSASKSYGKAKKLLGKSTLSDEDKKFLAAYISFRRLVLDVLNREKQFTNWTGAAKKINTLPARKILKEIFLLPEVGQPIDKK